MLPMADQKKPKKPAKPPAPPLNEEAAKAERARDRGEVFLLTVEITPANHKLLSQAMKQTRLKKRAIVEIALERYFQELGLPPPPPSPAE